MMHARQTRKCINPASTFGVVLQKSKLNDFFLIFLLIKPQITPAPLFINIE